MTNLGGALGGVCVGRVRAGRFENQAASKVFAFGLFSSSVTSARS